jgi:hypothetical protein
MGGQLATCEYIIVRCEMQENQFYDKNIYGVISSFSGSIHSIFSGFTLKNNAITHFNSYGDSLISNELR